MESLDVRLRDVRGIAAQDAWVAEGVFLWWIDDLLHAADLVVWLDVPCRVAAWRIVLRHVKASLAGTNRHPGLWKLLRFLQWTRRYYMTTRPAVRDGPDDDSACSRVATAERLSLFSHKVVHCRRASDMEAVQRALSGE